MIFKTLTDNYDCYLVDDGTLDTVISVDGNNVRFDAEYASQYRTTSGKLTENGFIELAREAIEHHEDIAFYGI